MEKLTLTRVTRITKDKAGNPLTTKAGKPYTRLLINTNEYGQTALSGFDGSATESWKEGMTVEAEVEKKGDYLNFSVPNKQAQATSEMKDMLQKIYREIYACRQEMALLKQALQEKDVLPTSAYPESNGPTAFDGPGEDDISPEDIPY